MLPVERAMHSDQPMISQPAGACSASVLTAHTPGAIAIIQLRGHLEYALGSITGRADWPIGAMRRSAFRAIDDGIVVRISDSCAFLMPHGGPRVVQRIMAELQQFGVNISERATTGSEELVDHFPETHDDLTAHMLRTLATAVSPLAIDLLLDQPRRWQMHRSDPGAMWTTEDDARSHRLNRLITPPVVVVAGPANAGKSTLCNALFGRTMSIDFDQPGTTRDYTSGQIDLAGLVVRWHDTPGLRATGDDIEQRAIEVAQRLMESADLLIALTDHEQDWPAISREPNLRVANKCDLGERADADLHISARTGEGLAGLTNAIREWLVPEADRTNPRPWKFCPLC